MIQENGRIIGTIESNHTGARYVNIEYSDLIIAYPADHFHVWLALHARFSGEWNAEAFT